MKMRLTLLVLLLALLASCAPTVTTAPTASPVPPTSTAIPTATYTPFPPTPTPGLTLAPPTPLPKLNLPIFTPDAIQVARWKEYQATLANCVFRDFGEAGGECLSSNSTDALCEWDILGRSGQEVYVWVECDNGVAGEKPLVVYLEMDGSIQKVKYGGYKDHGLQYNLELFPADVQKKMFLYTGDSLFHGRVREMLDHLLYRETHADVPPLIVLSATPQP